MNQTISVNEYTILKQNALKQAFAKMNEKQREAVLHTDGPVLILAGAGSGKTTVLVNRVANIVRFGRAAVSAAVPKWLTEDDVQFLKDFAAGTESDQQRLSEIIGVDIPKPWNILAITFTNKAAGELKERLANMLGECANDIMAATFHSACVRILRREIEALGYGKSFTIYDTDDSLRVIKDAMKTLSLDDKTFPPKSVLSAIGRAKDDMLTPEQLAQNSNGDFRTGMIAKIYKQYQQTLKNANAVDFDDIIVLTVRLFEEHPDVLEHYQNRYKYIMVDEYQDTNHAQYKLVSMLADKHKNLCVVGDDDQSIYKFRGATIENILSFENQFSGAKVIRLEQNYRCTQRILDAANAVIANNTERKGKTLWTDNGEGEQVKLFRSSDEQGEARFIVDTVLSKIEEGGTYKDHAVLYRMNAQSNMIERAFVKAGIPYKIIGGLRFFERKEIRDMIAYLSVINNPNDTVRLKRIINEPKRGIGDSTVAAVEEIAQNLGISMFEVIANADSYAPIQKKAKPLQEFAQMILELTELAQTEPLGELLDALLEKTGYSIFLLAQGFEGQTRMENIEELKSTMVKFVEENEEGDLSQFLEEVALYTDMDRTDLDDDVVVMMTLHSAKGLEFPYVFIGGFEEGIFPGRMSMNSPAEIEEERRLAYVGITRAKKQLYLTTAAQRLLFGQTTRNRLSRFVNEIPKDLLDVQDATVRLQHTPVVQDTINPHTISTGGLSAASVSKTPQVKLDIKPGDMVSHKVFGEGMVLSVTPMANDLLVEAAFDKSGTKKLMANFARLKKI
ncbi:UvrD-helicase domain-containing protein [Hydrogenoanaerobacterium sp.]|uniref:ATP-dependent helicase n=1 Tax=Hydrogenoanaerobacterium sp. TaxID=2953763 RepID=UPI00289A1A90|nr:UvrD-helicase domain-containing protein [Hydrogenoanaerobacterium sp.]